jgi:hypothetical protein
MMKRNGIGALIFFAMLFFVAPSASSSAQRTIRPEEILARTGGENSLRGAILSDGTVCAFENAASEKCRPLLSIPPAVTNAFGEGIAFFDGIFDLDRSGAPAVFIDYWPDSDDPNCPSQYESKTNGASGCWAVTLLVYKKSGPTYDEYMALHAPTEGHSPGAWFIDESPLRQAIFKTRYGGSSGNGLFYLNWKKRELELITDDFYMIDSPDFEELDKDGKAEIFVTARGHDRTAKQGVALLRRQEDSYVLWWPKFRAPYVMYAQLVPVAGDVRQEIMAVLDPGTKNPLGRTGASRTGRMEAGWR